MDRDEALKVLCNSHPSVWNSFREAHKEWIPDLSGAVIELKNSLYGIDLSGASLFGATIEAPGIGGEVVLHSADLSNSDLSNSKIHAWLERANLSDANLRGADLQKCSGLVSANLTGAIFNAETAFPPLDNGGGVFNPIERGAVFSAITPPTNRGPRHQCFISYAWADEEVVLALDAWLRRKGLRTKLDRRDFFAGSRIRDEIMRVMAGCGTILIFHSQESASKPWPEFERELASDLEMTAKQQGEPPPRIIYVVIDDVALPSVSEENKIAVMAKGKRFELVCEEIYHAILQLPRKAQEIDLEKWADYVF